MFHNPYIPKIHRMPRYDSLFPEFNPVINIRQFKYAFDRGKRHAGFQPRMALIRPTPFRPSTIVLDARLLLRDEQAILKRYGSMFDSVSVFRRDQIPRSSGRALRR